MGVQDADALANTVDYLSTHPSPHPQPTPGSRVEAALPTGTRVGRYVIERQLGHGGMGAVYAATDPELDRKVAIKVLHPHLAALQARLLREGQAVAKLRHPNVVTIHDVGSIGDNLFIAMELVAGQTLRRWCSETRRSWREIVDVFVAAGNGLAAAHAGGLVHRDFKPDNVLIGDDGRVVVTDFGLATTDGTSSPTMPADVPLDRLTCTGEIMGTPLYMAPEQHLGEPVGARADQFAFCVALYETLYGRPPFEGERYDELVKHVTSGQPVPPPEARFPPAIRDAITRGLARRPEDRFPSMTTLLAALVAPRVPRRRKLAIAIGAIALAAIIGALAFAWPRGNPDAPPPPPPVETQTADQAYAEGEAAYNRGDFETAVRAFKRGFTLEPDLSSSKSLSYLFNLGQAYRQLHNCREASFAFKRFLALKVNVPPALRADVERRIAEMERCMAAQAEEANR